jgi:hypothetical protein
METGNKESVRRKAEALLQQGFLSPERDPAVHAGEPLAVMNPDGGQHSWFVPLEVGPKLAGFAQFLTSLVPLRVSGFQQASGNYDRCPDLADWTDVSRILGRASSMAREGEQLSEPILTYDRDPSRLTWRVLAKSSSGASRYLFVAGTAVYEASGSRGLG